MSQYGYFVRPLMVFNRAVQGFGESTGGSASNAVPRTTLTQALMPGMNFKPPVFNAQALKCDTTRACPNLGELQTARAGIESQVQKTAGDFKQNWQAAKAQAYESVANVAMERGLDPVAAWKTLSPQASASELQIMVDVASGMAATGAGSFATFLKSPTTNIADALGDKTISAADAESIAAEAYTRMSSAPVQNGTYAPSQITAPDTEKSGFKWDNLGPDRFREFLAADLGQQPEWKTLSAAQASLDDVKNNHDLARNLEFDGRGNKPQAALEREDTGAIKAMSAQTEPLTSAQALCNSQALGDVRGVVLNPADVQGLSVTARETLLATLNNEPDPRRLMAKPFTLSAGMPGAA
jgi:hypothetical protein